MNSNSRILNNDNKIKIFLPQNNMLANPSEIMVGIDVGTTHVSVVVGQMDSETGDLIIKGYVRVPMPAESLQFGAVKNLEQVRLTAKEALRLVTERASMEKISSAVANLGGYEMKFSIQNGSIMVDTDLNETVNLATVMQLRTSMSKTNIENGYFSTDILPRLYRLDNTEQELYEPIGWVANKLEGDFSFLLHPYKNYSNVRASLQKAGLEEVRLVSSALAPGMAVLRKEDKNSGVAVVDIGASTTDITIYEKGYLTYVVTLPIGGDAITKDIQSLCNNITKEFAERLKVENGMAWPEYAEREKYFKLEGVRQKQAGFISQYTLACIITDRMEEIANLVLEQLMSRGFENQAQLMAGIVLTGGTAQMRHIKELFEYVTGFTCEIGNPVEFVNSNGAHAEVLKRPQWSTCIGLLSSAFLSLDERDNSRLRDVRNYYESKDPNNSARMKSESPIIQSESVKKKDSLVDIFTNWVNGQGGSEDYTS